MAEMSIPKGLIRAIKNMYKSNTVNIKVGRKIATKFETSKGLLYGSQRHQHFLKSLSATTKNEINNRLDQIRTAIKQSHSIIWNKNIKLKTKKMIHIHDT